jgi:hypothetical protein
MRCAWRDPPLSIGESLARVGEMRDAGIASIGPANKPGTGGGWGVFAAELFFRPAFAFTRPSAEILFTFPIRADLFSRIPASIGGASERQNKS